MAEDLYKIGVIARIKQVVHLADNGIKLRSGIERAEIMSVVQNEPYLTGSVCVSNRSPHATPQEQKRLAALHRRDLKRPSAGSVRCRRIFCSASAAEGLR